MRKYEVVIRFQSVEFPAKLRVFYYFEFLIFQIFDDFVNICKVCRRLISHLRGEDRLG